MIEIKPLTPHHISDIIPLVLAKCKKANTIFPNLFNQTIINTSLISKLNDVLLNNSGYGAFQKDKLVAFLLGYSRIPKLKGQERGSYVPVWGHYINDLDDKTFYRLYHSLAQDWVKESVHNHIISYFPNNPSFQEQLYTLGFGLLVIDAIRSMELISAKSLQSKFIIRYMTPEDYQEMQQIEADFCSYMRSSPTFLHSFPSEPFPPQKEYISDKCQTFVVEHQSKIIAAIRGVLGNSNFDLLSHPQNIAINYAYTNLEFRGFGLGTHLINEVLKWGSSHQTTRCTVDFESANIIALRFWLSHFAPIAYSAIRKIDNRL